MKNSSARNLAFLIVVSLVLSILLFLAIDAPIDNLQNDFHPYQSGSLLLTEYYKKELP